jgi:hypothetical protein
MALNPTQILYRDEYVASFEQRQSYLRDRVTTEAMIKGASAVFLVTGKADTMKERGVDGLIPAASEIDTQVTITLKEMHHRATATGFDIFGGQSDRRRILQERGMKAANKEMDDTILTALNATTTNYNSGSAITLSYAKLVDIISDLYESEVDNDGMITCVWSPKTYARILTFAQATSVDYVNSKPLVDSYQAPFRFLGAMHIMHPRVPGVGTSSAKNYVYHKAAIGHAIDTGSIKVDVGYNGEHDYSYARHSIYHGAKILQNAGVIEVTTDDTASF